MLLVIPVCTKRKPQHAAPLIGLTTSGVNICKTSSMSGTTNPLSGAIVDPPSLKPGSLASFSFSNREELKTGKEPFPPSPRTCMPKVVNKKQTQGNYNYEMHGSAGQLKSANKAPATPGYTLSRLREENNDDESSIRQPRMDRRRRGSMQRSSCSPNVRSNSDYPSSSREWSPSGRPKLPSNPWSILSGTLEESNDTISAPDKTTSGLDREDDDLIIDRTQSVDSRNDCRRNNSYSCSRAVKGMSDFQNFDKKSSTHNARTETRRWRCSEGQAQAQKPVKKPVNSPRSPRTSPRHAKKNSSSDALPQLARVAMVRSAWNTNSRDGLKDNNSSNDADDRMVVRRTRSQLVGRSPKSHNSEKSDSFVNTQIERNQNQLYSDMQAQVPCWNWKFGENVCQFGKHCHYMHAYRDGTLESDHDTIAGATKEGELRRRHSLASKSNVQRKEMLSQMTPINTSKIDCKFFNFGRGKCTFGKRCFYRHGNLDGTVHEETSGSSVELSLRFNNPYGYGDICAAGIIPYTRFGPSLLPDNVGATGAPGTGPTLGYDGKGCADLAQSGEAVWALLQVEDMFVPETNEWVPSLAMFGGKVALHDSDWRFTAAREFQEEVGKILGDTDKGIPHKICTFSRCDPVCASGYTTYLEDSKYQMLAYPIEDCDIQSWVDLPKHYWEKFKGKVAKDWSRAATRIEPVVLERVNNRWHVRNIWTGEPHELPLKVIQKAALKEVLFPFNDSEATRLANERKEREKNEVTNTIEDIESTLDNLVITPNDVAAGILSGLDFLNEVKKGELYFFDDTQEGGQPESEDGEEDEWTVVPARRNSTRKNRVNYDSGGDNTGSNTKSGLPII
eukprot:CFRG2357T1